MSSASMRIPSRGIRVRLSVTLILMFAMALTAWARPGYLSGPDVHGDQLVFTTEGDLWTGRIDGSSVNSIHRITSHVGNEVSPKFSPDGKHIAFSAQYDGNVDVFVMPVEGGEPRRITWHPSRDNVVGWTPDGEKILFVASRHSAHGDPEMYMVPARGGDAMQVPIGRANYLAIDPDSGDWAFTRTWGGGTWKRYRGGTAPEIWVGDPGKQNYEEVTDFDGIDLFPMWHGGKIYFLSDKGGTANIWSMKPDGSRRSRLTDFDTWDARGPSMGPSGRIVFSLAGDIHIFNPSTDDEQTLNIDLPSERAFTRKRYPNPGRYLTEYGLSPDGERVVIASRGELFTIPVEDGVALPVTRGSGARESRFNFLDDGERIVYITDDSGEEAIMSADAWGRGEVETIKAAGEFGYHFNPMISPDDRWLAYGDITHGLFLLDLEAEDAEPMEVAHSEGWEIHEYVWSPDGRWLAYTTNNMIGNGTIFIYDTQEEIAHPVTGDMTDDYDPTWDPEGKFLYFLSNRSIDPLIGNRDFETIDDQATKAYMLFLRPDVENPFLDQAGIPPVEEDEDEEAEDEEGDGEDEESEAEGEDDDADSEEDAEAEDGDSEDAEGDDEDAENEEEDEEKLDPVEIDFDGIIDRFVELPIPAGGYWGLGASSGKIFYMSAPMTGMAGTSWADDGPGGVTLMSYGIGDDDPSTFMAGVNSYDLQPAASKMAVSKGRGLIYVVGVAAPPGDLSDAAVSFSGVVIDLDPREEWEQIYYEAWRGLRDFYWDENMHGLDWEAIRDQYATMLPRLATRSDLRDLIAELIGELSTGHTYVWGGDQKPGAQWRGTGLLGAEFVREGDAFKVDHIYRGGHPDRVRSPLDEPGVDIDEGSYILEVNLMPFSEDLPFEAAFENMAGHEIMLTVVDSLGSEDTRHVVLKPIYSNFQLLYADWVRKNREYVLEKTDGKIGYIHIPDMGGRGMVEFDTWFYPQLVKEGMVVDTRWNGGGFVSQLILARFQRSIISWDRMRYGTLSTYPARVLNGPFVVLTNENAGSDGDIFPAAIQMEGLAPVIGKRSWGGVVGIRGVKPFVDGGVLTHPEFAWWDDQKGWGLEGHGVDPDIEVDNLPQDLARGIDAQLDRGILEVMKLHKQNPPEKPDFGPEPDRSRKAYRNEK
jgi:tricorn protease